MQVETKEPNEDNAKVPSWFIKAWINGAYEMEKEVSNSGESSREALVS